MVASALGINCRGESGRTLMSEAAHGEIHFVDAILMKLAQDAPSAKERFGMLSRMPRGLPSELKSLWADMAFCFIFRQDYAALCVCGAFVECFLERSIVDFEEKNGITPTSLPSQPYGLIERAAKIGLVSEKERQMLHGFRKFIRNLYSHGDADTSGDLFFSIKGAGFATFEEGEVKIEYLNDKELEKLRRATAKERWDLTTKKFAEPVVREIGQWARECASKVYKTAA
jgi:hypothetical protein